MENHISVQTVDKYLEGVNYSIMSLKTLPVVVKISKKVNDIYIFNDISFSS